MELLEGEDLFSRLKRKPVLSLGELGPIVSQMTRGLSRAHEAGLVHRDLKPANVFLVDDDGRDLVKVLDFGVAKATAAAPGAATEDVTSTGEVIGSLHYMAPEQARGLRNLDHRADLWSIGVIAFRCLTGTKPFDGEGAGDVLLNICTAPLPRATSLVPSLPSAIDAFFDRALAREPGDRFGSARELADAFDAIVRQGVASAVAGSIPPVSSMDASLRDGRLPVSGRSSQIEPTTRVPLTADPSMRRSSGRKAVGAGIAVGALALVAIAAVIGASFVGSRSGTAEGEPTSRGAPATPPPATASPSSSATVESISTGQVASAPMIEAPSAAPAKPAAVPATGRRPAAGAAKQPCKSQEMFGIPCEGQR